MADSVTTKSEEELHERIALCLKVLFPNEAWDTYVRSAVCLIHEFRRKIHAEAKMSA
jgi:hypothetical protein